jgi:hypothetical protein
MKARFLTEFELVKMSKNSIMVRNNKSGEIAYIHRNAFNSLDAAVDYKMTWRPEMNTNWIEVLVWRTI